jgi:hypothetical protein
VKWLAVIFAAFLGLLQTNAAQAYWQSRNQVSAGVSYIGPGDITSFVHWYGLRAYSSVTAIANANVADLVASTGGATVCTLKLASNGDADVTSTYCLGLTVPAACAAASGSACKVTRLYDQVGTFHVTQATLAQMPTLMFNVLGGNKPAMFFVAANAQALLVLGSGTIAQPLSMSMVARRPTVGTPSNMVLADGGTGTGQVAFGFFNSANLIFGYAPTNQVFFAPDSSFHAAQMVANAGAGNIYIDGNANTAGLGSSAFNMATYRVGGDSYSNWMDGYICETGIASGAFSVAGGGTASLLNTNQHSYWGF